MGLDVARFGTLYLILYLVSFAGLAVYASVDDGWTKNQWLGTLANVTSAALSVPLFFEGVRVFMVLATLLKEKYLHADVKKWEAWNERREEFEKENPGQKFIEPPPTRKAKKR